MSTTAVPPNLAFGFVTWAFFWAGLAAISIPVIIHILNRRRFKTVTWAAMDFLLRAMKKNRRRLRFEQWVLLATRCLLVFLLGMALARPLSCESQSVAGIGGRTGLNVIVIDNSYSMAYESNRANGSKTHLDQAKKVAKALIERMNSGGESVSIVTASRPAAPVAGFDKPSYNLAAASAAVDRVEQTFGSTDLVGAMQLALRAAREENRQPVKNLYVLSDATRSAWESPQQADALKQTAQDLAKVFRVTHYNMAEGQQQWNQAALALSPTSNLVTTKFGSDFAATVKGFGAGPDVALRWSLNDAAFPETPALRLDTDTAPQLQTGARFKSGGPQVLSVSVMTNDGLDFDNTRWRVVDVASALKVLIVEGQRGVNVLEGSGAFLQVALSPTAEASGPGGPKTTSYVASELISDLELGNKVLGDYRAVVLAGVGQLAPTQADALAAFVKQGGTLMVFMGEPVDPQNYNASLLPRKLLPGPLVKRVQVASDQKGFGFDFDPGGNLHPLLSVFRNQPNTGLDTAEVFTYWQADVPARADVERVLNFQTPGGAPAAGAGGGAATRPASDPAITVHSVGDGRVVFVATTANAEWTTLPSKPVYVALVHELLSGSVRTGDAWLNRVAGQSLEIPATVRLSAAPTLLDPAKNPVVIEASEAEGGATVYRSRPLTRPGVYTLSTGSGNLPVAVNVPPDEADVRTLPQEAIRSALGGIELTMRGPDVPATAVAAETGNDLSWAFMLAVFALLAVECFMAMRFGHHRRSDVRPRAA
jgi:hypothetical protein